MNINVSTNMGFQNQDFFKNAAKEILQKKNADSEASNEFSQKTILGSVLNNSSKLSILEASTQITLNNSLKETLRYLQAHANDKRKKYVLGELWDRFENIDNYDEKAAELLDFEIDDNAKNIFAA